MQDGNTGFPSDMHWGKDVDYNILPLINGTHKLETKEWLDPAVKKLNLRTARV